MTRVLSNQNGCSIDGVELPSENPYRCKCLSEKEGIDMGLVFDTLGNACRSRATDALRADPPTSPTLIIPAPLRASMPMNEERRNHARTRVSMDVRLRPAHAKDGDFKEVLSTQDFSRHGLYFISSSRHYHLKMRLRVVFPYSSEHDIITLEENAEVTRLKDLSNSRLGVAISLGRSSAHVAFGSASSVSSGLHKERRRSERHWFSATAQIIEFDSKMRLQARCSDLSLTGLYVDTLNPFRDGSAVQIRISNEEKVFESFASVVSSHAGMGMGLEFGELSPEEKSVLTGWLPTKI